MDDRWAERERRLVEMWPDIHDPASPRYYAARMTGRDWKILIEIDRLNALKLGPSV